MGRLKEEWKDVVGFEGLYKISNMGRVLSLGRTYKTKSGGSRIIKSRYLKPSKVKGYDKVSLFNKEGISKSITIHKLVAQAFLEKPLGYSQINHKDGIKTNNKVSNLKWCTPKENIRHALETGLFPVGEESKASKLTTKQVLEISELINKGENTFKQISEMFNVDRTLIGLINTGSIWSSVTGMNNEPRIKPNSTPVVNCRGERFESATEAALKLGQAGPSHILASCKGVRKGSGRYEDGTLIRWKYSVSTKTALIGKNK